MISQFNIVLGSRVIPCSPYVLRNIVVMLIENIIYNKYLNLNMYIF